MEEAQALAESVGRIRHRNACQGQVLVRTYCISFQPKTGSPPSTRRLEASRSLDLNLLFHAGALNTFPTTPAEKPETETYLIQLESDCFAWKQAEFDHKRLMREVSRRLPWETVACHLDDGHVVVVFSTNMEPPIDPFEVNPKPLAQCPIPDSPQRHTGTQVRLRVIKRKRTQHLKRADSLTRLIREIDAKK